MDFLENAALPEAACLLKDDRFTFSVAARIVQDPCRRIMTDHRRLLIVQSSEVYPTWVWTPEDASAAELTEAWRILRQAFPPVPPMCYNVKHPLAEIMMKDEPGLEILANLYAYSCPAPIPPAKHPGGQLALAGEEDLDAVTALWATFYREIGQDTDAEERARQNALQHISAGRLYVWKDGGRVAAACHIREPQENLTCISGVVTAPDLRRRGYAANMIYAVCQVLHARGELPTLYTDADYPASNRCYAQVGFVLQGSLCTVGVKA